jgi:hypothetical protein
MANIPAIPVLSGDLLRDDPDAFADGVSDFLVAVRNALTSDLIVGQNVCGQYNTRKVYIGDATSPYPFSFEWEFPTRSPAACLVVNVTSAEGELRGVMSGIAVNFTFYDNKVVVNGLAGQLEPNKWYTFTFMTLAG